MREYLFTKTEMYPVFFSFGKLLSTGGIHDPKSANRDFILRVDMEWT